MTRVSALRTTGSGATCRAGDSSMPHMSSPDPSRIVDVLCAYWQTAALTAAIDLGVFTALGGRARTRLGTGQARAGRTAASLERLCDSLVSLGLLRSGDGRYRAAADAARFLDARSPESLVAIRRFFNAPPVTTALADLGRDGARRTEGRDRGRPAASWPAFAASTLALRRRAAKEIAAALVRRVARRRPHPRCRRGRIAARHRVASALARPPRWSRGIAQRW